MERLHELGVEREDRRKQAKEILAACRKGKRHPTEEEGTKLEALTAELEQIEATIKFEREALEWDRSGARAVDRPADERGGQVDEDRDPPALALPPLPKRTRAKLEAMAGGASSTLAQRRENFAAVVTAALGGNPFHPSLIPLAATSNEAVGSEGGFATRPDVSAGIFTRAAEESVWMRIGARVETMISDEKTVVALDDDDESGDKEAGLLGGWTGEATEATAQVMLLRSITLSAKKLMVLAAVSNELGEDGPSYLDALEPAISRAIGKKFDRAALSGNGVGQPLGILNSASTIEVSKTVDGDPGTANTFTWRHAVGMWSRLAPGSHENSWWLAHPTVLPQLLSMHLKVMNVAATENVGGFQPLSAFAPGGPTGYMLLGRPVVITGRVKAAELERVTSCWWIRRNTPSASGARSRSTVRRTSTSARTGWPSAGSSAATACRCGTRRRRCRRALRPWAPPSCCRRGNAVKVRYLRGNQAGMLDELPERDALAAIADGFCEAVVPPVVAEAPKSSTPKASTRQPRSRPGTKLQRTTRRRQAAR